MIGGEGAAVTLQGVRSGMSVSELPKRVEKALHERYKHCLGPGGLKIALAQRDGAGGTGGTLCDKYYVRMPF